MTNDTMPEEIWASEFDESRQIGVAFALRENEICRTKYIRADLYEGAVERHNKMWGRVKKQRKAIKQLRERLEHARNVLHTVDMHDAALGCGETLEQTKEWDDDVHKMD